MNTRLAHAAAVKQLLIAGARRGFNLRYVGDDEFLFGQTRLTLLAVEQLLAGTEPRPEPARPAPMPQALRDAARVGKCSRCGGSGHLGQFGHVENGVCFRCNGTGTELPRPRITPQMRDAAKAGYARTAQRKAACDHCDGTGTVRLGPGRFGTCTRCARGSL